MTNLFFIGYMGSGKTTLGRAYARAVGYEFIDLDAYIEARFRCTVSQIFTDRGEDGFREIERNMLEEVANFENVLVACGGGTPCFFQNMAVMNQHGITIYLDASIDTLFRRLKVAKTKRPLLMNKSDEELRRFISENLERRLPYYQQAQKIFPTDHLESRDQIAQAVNDLHQLLDNK